MVKYIWVSIKSSCGLKILLFFMYMARSQSDTPLVIASNSTSIILLDTCKVCHQQTGYKCYWQPITLFLSFIFFLFCCVVLCCVLFCKIKEKELSVHTLSLSLSLLSHHSPPGINPILSCAIHDIVWNFLDHRSNFIGCWNLHLVATKSTNTTHTHPTHIYACVLLLSNPVACSRVQTQLVHHFYLVFVLFLYFTFKPTQPIPPPTHPSPSSLHFFWLDQNEKTQSKLAGWLFPGGRVHMFFAFQKSWKKKLGLVVVLLPFQSKMQKM